ncbi:DUF5666 domain-containing protein [Rhodococcus sp. OK270]|uniref:DUF5666 domain-containing protein n=1 Tax=Rhodococcus sp. OK270 TaxID=1882814 RepID=UPI000BD70686|nr:DUF5666 domain-containing protein [Rhodococcus sp. OK270]SNX89248.1 hypothetical protein SAMN05447004_10251 [Rhodococcus sp. OK270]
MNNTDDPRTPQERTGDGTEPFDAGPDPTAEWAPAAEGAAPDQPTEVWARGADQPTQQFDRSAGPVTPEYTTDPHQAYGQVPPNATQAYPTYQGYDPNQPPNATQAYPTYQGYDPNQPPNATQAYPTYQGYDPNQPPNATQAYPTYQGYDPNQPPTPPPTGADPYLDGDQKKGPGKGVLAVALVVAGLLLLAVVGLGVMLIGGGGKDSPSSASAPVTSTLPRASTAPPRTSLPPATSAPDLSQIPGGVGEAIGAAGAAVGTITSNDGSTLILDGIGGSAVTVVTNGSTKIISLSGAKVGDLKPGDTVVVQGEKGDDGSVLAKVIVNTTLPDLGNFGN